MTLKRRRRRTRGFTLVEILIALGLSVVGLLGMLALQTVAMRGNASSRNFTEATGIAQTQLEALMVMPYASLSGVDQTEADNVGPTTAALYKPTAKATPEDIYSRQITITPGATSTAVLVDVWWLDPQDTTGTRKHHVRLYGTRAL